MNKRCLLEIFQEPSPQLLNHYLKTIQGVRSDKKHPLFDKEIPVYFDRMLTEVIKYNELNYKTLVILMWMDYNPRYRAIMMKRDPPVVVDWFTNALKESMAALMTGMKLDGTAYTPTDNLQERSPGYVVCALRALYMGM